MADSLLLSRDDFKALLHLIERLPDFEDAATRRAVWLTPAFRGYKLEKAVVSHAPLQGETRPAVAAKLLNHLIEFGMVAEGVYALGAFLSHVAEKVGLEEAALARRIITVYGLLPVTAPAAAGTPVPVGRLKNLADLHWRSADAAADRQGLERLKREGRPDWVPANFLDEGARVKPAVAYVKASFSTGDLEGTGFLIGQDLLLTCYHVLHDTHRGHELASEVEVRFGYERSAKNLPVPQRKFKAVMTSLQGDADGDWVVFRLQPPPPDNIPRLPLGSPVEVAVDDRVYILHHPEGQPMKLAMHGNPVRYADATVLQYLADTEQGSSGAPVFNEHWQVVGLHRRWVEMEGAETVYRNEAVNIRRVEEALVARGLLPGPGHAETGTAEDSARELPVPSIPGGGQEAAARPKDRGAPALTPEAALIARIRAEGPSVALADEEVLRLQAIRPVDDESYRLRRLADWREPHLAMRGEDLRRFTGLTLLVDKGEDADLRWVEEKQEYHGLADVLRAVEGRYPALVLLGEPGAGKTTLLRHLELELACQGLGWVATAEADAELEPAAPGDGAGRVADVPLTFYLPLAEYRDATTLPLDWLARRWATTYPDMPALDAVLRTPALLLLDALNEMPHGGTAGSYAERVAAWSLALGDLHRDYPLARVVISCRSLDYSSSLSSHALRVPHVQVKRLEDEQVLAFLTCYLPQRADELWGKLEGSELLDIYRTPYFLKLLVDQIGSGGDIPTGRAPLFAGFIRQALRRELNTRKSPLFVQGDLLHERDRAALAREGSVLPVRGPLLPRLAHLAFQMQLTRGAGQQVVVDRDVAEGLLEHESAEDIVKAGYALGMLELPFDGDRELEMLRFKHQLLQEYFAARRLAEQPDPSLVRSAWHVDEVVPTLAQTIAALASSDPLLNLPQTGWEQTTLLAAQVASDPGAFLRPLLDVNLPLAARCATEPGVKEKLPEGLWAELQQRLIARCQDTKADLRARIDAGKALGEIGDPRFARRQGPTGSTYLLPPLVAIPGGRYSIGAPDGWSGERPVHEVTVAPFAISRFPVTNAEYACFLEAGGYEDEQWWETEDAKAWLRGEPRIVEPAKEDRRELWRDIPRDEAGFKSWLADRPGITDPDWYVWFRNLSADGLERQLDAWYPSQRYTQPENWLNPRYNNPAQPVVGVCWYEARAYCRWLADQSGLQLRLPTEVEWEAAARGSKGRRYAYGDEFDGASCNTHEAHIRSTTPISIYPDGETPEGLVDMTGNVWEWTLSLWGRDRNRIDDRYRYPYRSGEGREDVEADPGCARVLRGGSWSSGLSGARAAYRDFSHPAFRSVGGGFRVVRGSPISPGL